MNEQRKIIYAQRQMVLDGEDISGTIKNMMESAIDSALDDYIGISEIPEDWNIRAITEFANQYLNAQGEFKIPEEDMETITKADVKDMLMELGNKCYESQEEVFGENMRELERVLMLRVVDTLWMDHLDEMEHVKREIGLRAYGQHDPVLEYRNVGSELYENMLDSIKKDTVRYVLSAMPRVKIEREQVAKPLDTGGDGSLGNTPKRARKNRAETILAHAAAVKSTRTAAVKTNNLNKPYGFVYNLKGIAFCNTLFIRNLYERI